MWNLNQFGYSFREQSCSHQPEGHTAWEDYVDPMCPETELFRVVWGLNVISIRDFLVLPLAIRFGKNKMWKQVRFRAPGPITLNLRYLSGASYGSPQLFVFCIFPVGIKDGYANQGLSTFDIIFLSSVPSAGFYNVLLWVCLTQATLPKVVINCIHFMLTA